MKRNTLVQLGRRPDAMLGSLMTNPMANLTNVELARLVERYPERWGEFADWVGKLPN